MKGEDVRWYAKVSLFQSKHLNLQCDIIEEEFVYSTREFPHGATRINKGWVIMLFFLLSLITVEERSKLEGLYNHYHKLMYFVAFDLLKDSYAAQDVMQSAIIKIMNYLDKIDDVYCNKTKHLIVVIVKNTSIDLLRKRENETFLSVDALEGMADPEALRLEDIVIRLSESQALLEKLNYIKPEYAEILSLKFYHELNDREIAEVLSISHENARVRLHRAKNALKKLISSDHSEGFIDRGMCADEASS